VMLRSAAAGIVLAARDIAAGEIDGPFGAPGGATTVGEASPRFPLVQWI
jgi:hypothetical protein